MLIYEISSNDKLQIFFTSYYLNVENLICYVLSISNYPINKGNKITDSDVSNALPTDYLDKKYLFDDSNIARHERFGPMIQPEIDFKENQNIIEP